MLRAMRSKVAAAVVAVGMICASAGTADANILTRLLPSINTYLTGLQGAVTQFQAEVQANPTTARINLATNVLNLRLQLYQNVLNALVPAPAPTSP